MSRGKQEESETGGSLYNESRQTARGENGDCNAGDASSMERGSNIEATVSRRPQQRPLGTSCLPHCRLTECNKLTRERECLYHWRNCRQE